MNAKTTLRIGFMVAIASTMIGCGDDDNSPDSPADAEVAGAGGMDASSEAGKSGQPAPSGDGGSDPGVEEPPHCTSNCMPPIARCIAAVDHASDGMATPMCGECLCNKASEEVL